ncbi:hypothetical protein Ppa06_26330 [Planomonospora parontospora subsp. parontospora]|uniref:Uncharacterized protein n=2 Tax=Planomonospora parontospora TaxID=58119 RepID=A0AA37BEU3_9ACTN|nr:hypothetical protein [Planomonospora parontospora]GGK59944.1 hypothetical protein GCM10010126_19350 [Planomonospora parontospora]GII08835.1 hypothetical protein Ppa06_26330 [Planomonospora parontospora subsp. parontospora]
MKTIQELIEADDVGQVNEQDVQQAEQEAAEAEQLVDALEKRVIDGDEDITVEQITSQRELGRFARLRAQATARKAERARRAARLKALDELRAEIEAYATDGGAHLAKLAKEAEDANAAFLAAVAERNTRLQTWRKLMLGHEVPRHASPITPPAEHAHLGHTDAGQIIAGQRRMNRVDADEWFGHMIRAALHRAGTAVKLHLGGRTVTVDPASRDQVAALAGYARLAQVDAPAGEADPNLRFFLTSGGSVLALDREPNAAEARGIERELSRKEAGGA